VPSKPPPQPSLPTPSTPWWHSPPAKKAGEPAGINWSAILASISVSFALVVSVVAWIVTHPNKTAKSVESPRVAVIPSGSEIRVRPAACSISPAAREEVDEIEIIPAIHRPDWKEKIANPFLPIAEAPPPLPPPASRPTPPQPQPEPKPAAPQAAPQPAGETYGTQVLFLNNQEAAADLAKRDHKLLFVMHISGNFEDSCFT